MPTHYLYGTILTSEAVAANNRGDNIGNTTTLQKVFVGDDLHTSVSAEAIRFALRYRFQLQGEPVDRTFDVKTGTTRYRKDKHVPSWDLDDPYIDDDLMGFMDAKAAQQEQEEESSAEGAEPTEADAKSEQKAEGNAGGKRGARPGKNRDIEANRAGPRFDDLIQSRRPEHPFGNTATRHQRFQRVRFAAQTADRHDGQAD